MGGYLGEITSCTGRVLQQFSSRSTTSTNCWQKDHSGWAESDGCKLGWLSATRRGGLLLARSTALVASPHTMRAKPSSDRIWGAQRYRLRLSATPAATGRK